MTLNEREFQEFEDFIKKDFPDLFAKYESGNYFAGVIRNSMLAAWGKAKAQAVPEWINAEDEHPKGKCLVFLESDLCGNYIHSANFTENYSIVGSVFAWDAPKVKRWMPLLDGPSESGAEG